LPARHAVYVGHFTALARGDGHYFGGVGFAAILGHHRGFTLARGQHYPLASLFCRHGLAAVIGVVPMIPRAHLNPGFIYRWQSGGWSIPWVQYFIFRPTNSNTGTASSIFLCSAAAQFHYFAILKFVA
jgi:coproporphyrinogen III oxidase